MFKSLSAGHRDVTNFKLFKFMVIKFMVREKRAASLEFSLFS